MSWRNNDMRWTCPTCRRFLPIENGRFPFHGEIGLRCPMSEKPIAQQGKIERDYEPEQKYGTAHDFQEHIRYGGDRENY